MNPRRFLLSGYSACRLPAVFAIVVHLGACGGDDNRPPVALALSINAVEDTPLNGQLQATDPEGGPLTYALVGSPAKGTVQIDAATGAFVYMPAQDLNGLDSFTFSATDAKGARSTPARVSIDIAPVNDPPKFGTIASLTNSPEAPVIQYRLPVVDVDGDVLTFSATGYDPAVAMVEVDQATGAILVTQRDSGSTIITVSASDGEYTAQAEIPYSVSDVTKARPVASSRDAPRKVVITNSSAQSVSFTLRHNGHRLETSVESMIESIQGMADEIAAEPFERKLWRYLRDHVYHDLSISTRQFVHDPLTLINSIGWGLCDDVATAFMHVARASGRESRVWYLEGHVVPEVRSGDAWHMYDPDLFVYYHNESLQPASVDELSRQPSLVSAPIAPIFADTTGLTAYSDFMAGIYASTDDNQLAEDLVPNLVAPVPAVGAPLVLPPGGTITYPGLWAPLPNGFDGINSQPVAVAANLRLEIPAGWTGTVRLPLLLATVTGSGEILVDGVRIDGDQLDLTSSYQQRTVAPQEIEIRESRSPITIVMLLNPLPFSMTDANDVQVTGRDVWALQVAGVAVDPERAVDPAAVAAVRKPAP